MLTYALSGRLIQPSVTVDYGIISTRHHQLQYNIDQCLGTMAATTTKAVILDQPSHWEPWRFVVKTIADGGDT